MACFSLTMLNVSTINSAYAEQQADTSMIQGKVTDIIDISGYTYAEVNTGSSIAWAAGPKTALTIGDTVSFSTGMPMKDFYSESMERNFPIIYFIGQFNTDTNNADLSDKSVAHGQIKQLQKPVKGIDSVVGGKSISEIHTEKRNLNGKIILVRGQVTRFAADIMGKNWLHIQDSSSFDDLTATTDNTVAVGDIVIIEGKLELDKDYGYGYVYPVFLQNATVTKE